MLDQIKSLITLLFAICFMYLLLDCDFRSKKKPYLLGLFGVIMLICNIIVLVNFGYNYFMKLYPFLIQAPSLLIFSYTSRFRLIKVLFVHFTLIAVTTSVTMVGIVISGIWGGDKVIMNLICFILYPPLTLIFYKFLRPSFLYMLRNAERGWLGFCMIPISYTVLVYTASSYNVDVVMISPKAIVFTLLILTLTLSAYYLIFQFFKQAIKQLTLQNEQDLLRTQIASAQLHLEALQESQEKTIIYRHDMRHHLNLISAFLIDNNITAIKKYIAEVQTTIEGTVVEQYCNNYTVNLILYFYLTKAKHDQIEVKTQINIPENNKISDMDLCVIFSNAIENAINACLRITNTKDRVINIVCKSNNNKLCIKITNSYEGTLQFVDEVPVSFEENHGIGTKSIIAVVQKYNGVYTFSADNNIFNSVVVL